MSKFRLLEFPYRSKNGVLEVRDQVIYLDQELLNIKGEQKRAVFDPVKKKPVFMTGLYLQYKGIEYGSVTMNLAQLTALLEACNCPEDFSRIHVGQFCIQFV